MHDLRGLTGRTVLYVYPRTAKPGVTMPDDWNLIPGARGCTPQACAFRDHHAELLSLGARVFALSVQTAEEQQEAAQRLHLPFALLSDPARKFAGALKLPTFETGGTPLLRRVTLIVRAGQVEHVFSPVFPPDRNAANVLDWLRPHPAG